MLFRAQSNYQPGTTQHSSFDARITACEQNIVSLSTEMDNSKSHVINANVMMTKLQLQILHHYFLRSNSGHIQLLLIRVPQATAAGLVHQVNNASLADPPAIFSPVDLAAKLGPLDELDIDVPNFAEL